MRDFWRYQSVIVTGGSGFLGSYVVGKLKARDGNKVFVVRSKDYDLRCEYDVNKLFQDVPATMVIHLAAQVGGIGANQANPGSYFYDNAMMGLLVMEQARLAGVQKFVTVGTICAYPKLTPVPFREAELWNGYPEATNAPYGLAKKMLLVQGQAYRAQYGFNAIHLMPTNLYGPGDNFDPDTSHVIPALIKKCIEAQQNSAPSIEVWGDGSATRDFLYVKDAAEAILLAAEHYNAPEPVNLGSGVEISIRGLTALIAVLTGYTGKFTFDLTKPNGQPRRLLDTSRAREQFGFVAQMRLHDGLRETIAWYQAKL